MPLPDDPDVRLIERLVARDEQAFNALVRTYEGRIVRLLTRMVGNEEEARDLAQDVFVQVFKAIGSFRGDSKLSTWLYRIAVNTCLDYKKKSRPGQAEDESVIDDLASTEPSPEQRYQSKEIGQAIQLALQKLPESLRAAIVLKEIEDLSYEEIAEVLHTSIGTVKSRISRAREELRLLLRKKV